MFATLFTLISAVLVLNVRAESHTVKFQNNCGKGSPVLLAGGQVLANGTDYTSNGEIQSAIAYLQTGECLLNGENCAIVEMNINNPTCAGCGPSVDISLISPHKLNVPTAFAFYGGTGDVCDGLGASCATSNCNTAFFQSNDNQVQRACQADNVNLLITFCGSETSEFTEAVTGSLASLESGSGSGSESVSVSSSEKASSTAAPPSSSSAVAHSSSATATPSSAAVNAASPSEISSTGSISASSTVISVTSSSSAASPSKTCSRKRSVRAKRSASVAQHAQYHRRARAFAEVHGKF